MEVFANQKEMFEYIWDTREHVCEATWKYIYEARAWCFAHILGKWMFPKYKLDPNNILLVFDEKIHKDIDRLANKNKYILEQYLLRWERITYRVLLNL